MMSDDAARRKVFSRARLGRLELRNRIVKTATYEGMSPGGVQCAEFVDSFLQHRGVDDRVAAIDRGTLVWSRRRVACRDGSDAQDQCRSAGPKTGETKRWNLPLPTDSPPSIYLAEHVVIAFQVSSVMAVVRLKQLGLVA